MRVCACLLLRLSCYLQQCWSVSPPVDFFYLIIIYAGVDCFGYCQEEGSVCAAERSRDAGVVRDEG